MHRRGTKIEKEVDIFGANLATKPIAWTPMHRIKCRISYNILNLQLAPSLCKIGKFETKGTHEESAASSRLFAVLRSASGFYWPHYLITPTTNSVDSTQIISNPSATFRSQIVLFSLLEEKDLEITGRIWSSQWSWVGIGKRPTP